LAAAAAFVLAGAAEAKVYIDEDFDTGRMPSGWQARISGTSYASYSFQPRGGGYYFSAYVSAEGGTNAKVELTSAPITVNPRTLYYRFEFSSSSSGPERAVKRLYAKYVGASSHFYYEVLPGVSDWHEESGSFFVAEANPLVVIWEISVSAEPGRYGSGWMGVDTVKIFDEGDYAVDPTSWGRVKALYR